MIAETNNERNTVLVDAMLPRLQRLKARATNDNLLLHAVPADRRLYLYVDNYNQPIRASVPMVGDAEFKSSVSLNTLTDMLALESKFSDVSALRLAYHAGYTDASLGMGMTDFTTMYEGAKPLDFWGDEITVYNPKPDLTGPTNNARPIAFFYHPESTVITGAGWMTNLYKKTDADIPTITTETLHAIATFKASALAEVFGIVSKAVAKTDRQPVYQYMRMIIRCQEKQGDIRPVKIALTGADGYHAVTREFFGVIGSRWAELECDMPVILNVSPADFAPLLKGTTKELAQRDITISVDQDKTLYLECEDVLAPMDIYKHDYPKVGDLSIMSEQYAVSLTAEQVEALIKAIRNAKRGAKKDRSYRLIGRGPDADTELIALSDYNDGDRTVTLPLRLPDYLHMAFDTDMFIRCLDGMKGGCYWRMRPEKRDTVYGWAIDISAKHNPGDWSLFMSQEMDTTILGASAFSHPLKDNKPAPQPAQPDRALIVVGQDEPGIVSPRLIRRLHALARTYTTLPTGATIYLPGPKPDPEPDPITVATPEPEPEPADLTPVLLPLNDRLSFANNQIANLDADTRRDLGDILSDLIDFAVSFLQGDGYNHVALGTKAVDTSVQIRRVGRARCGHDRRDYGPTPETSPNSDRLATLRDKLAGASYGPEWNKPGKQESADKLRKMVKHLLGIDLPEDLPVHNSRVTYDGWLYRVTPTHTGAMTLQIERLMPVGWRGNKKPMWWPISRYFGWNDGQWCRQSVANIERVYQEELAKQKGKERAS